MVGRACMRGMCDGEHVLGVCLVGGMDGGGVQGVWQGGMCGRGGLHGRRDGHCSGWYASYWNASLFALMSNRLLPLMAS